jgi:hypothetical protein
LHTKNPNLEIFWKALEWKLLVYIYIYIYIYIYTYGTFMAICYLYSMATT